MEAKKENVMTLLIGLLLVLIALTLGGVVFEYRLRSPEDLILSEGKEGIRVLSGSWYPRHFSLAIKRTTYPLHMTVEAGAAGNLDLRVKLVGAVSPYLANLDGLVRTGGWNKDTVSKATLELQVYLQGLIKEFTERREIGAISSQGLQEYVTSKLAATQEKFGLAVISFGVHSVEAKDPAISGAMKEQEQSRILEETETLSQKARIRAAQARVKADEELANLESQLELRKAELEKLRFQKQAELAQQRLEEELRSNRLRLQFEKEELALLKGSPELLMLTPQAARLAEASQTLKNARTVISLSPQDTQQGAELLGLFQNFLNRSLGGKVTAATSAETAGPSSS